jgi:hypothetical protein
MGDDVLWGCDASLGFYRALSREDYLLLRDYGLVDAGPEHAGGYWLAGAYRFGNGSQGPS